MAAGGYRYDEEGDKTMEWDLTSECLLQADGLCVTRTGPYWSLPEGVALVTALQSIHRYRPQYTGTYCGKPVIAFDCEVEDTTAWLREVREAVVARSWTGGLGGGIWHDEGTGETQYVAVCQRVLHAAFWAEEASISAPMRRKLIIAERICTEYIWRRTRQMLMELMTRSAPAAKTSRRRPPPAAATAAHRNPPPRPQPKKERRQRWRCAM